MAEEIQTFRLHPQARVYLSGAPVDATDTGPGPMRLVAEPVAPCLAGLLAAVRQGTEFCVHATDQHAAQAPARPGTPGYLSAATSGTTSAPKRVRRSHASWIASFDTNARLFGLTPDDAYAVLGGLQHSLTLYALCEALHIGADLHVLSGQRPDRQWALMDRATVLYATPAQLRLLCAARPSGATRPALRLLLIGGGFLDPTTRRDAARAFPQARIAAFYGASETSFITLADDATPEGSVGRAYPGVEIAIRTPDGTATAPGETGEIWVRSPYLFTGYDGPGSDDTRWQDGFLTVGELGRMDPDGHLFLAGRISRMFTVADRNIFPEEIEEMLRALPGVTEAAVLPRPDPKRGQVPVAFLCGDLTEPDLPALLKTCRARLDPTSTPRALHLLTDWPRLASGKTDLRALEALL